MQFDDIGCIPSMHGGLLVKSSADYENISPKQMQYMN